MNGFQIPDVLFPEEAHHFDNACDGGLPTKEHTEWIAQRNELHDRHEKIEQLATEYNYFGYEDGLEYDDGHFSEFEIVVECRWCKTKQWINCFDATSDLSGEEWQGIGKGITIT